MDAAKKKKVKRGCAVAFILVLGFLLVWYGPLALGLYRQGFFDDMLHPQEQKRYEGTSIDNLKAMHTALLGFEDSEGQFPEGAKWMDAISNRLQTNDLKPGEGLRKLVHPRNAGQPAKYGYAYNDAVAGKYHGDIKDPKTIVVFESEGTEKNLHGDPAKLRKPGGLAITLSGEILRK